MNSQPREELSGRGRWANWSAGLMVALGAAAATAHGLFEVAEACRYPGRDRLALPADHRWSGLGRLRLKRPTHRDAAAPGLSWSWPPGCPGWPRPATSPAASPGGLLVGVHHQHRAFPGEGVAQPAAGGGVFGLFGGAAVDDPSVAVLILQHGGVAGS
jgi:hypothetical protein